MAPKTKAKAQSAAQAASKKKSSAVEITHHTEQQIRQALKVREWVQRKLVRPINQSINQRSTPSLPH